jgi:hypothetical protein
MDEVPLSELIHDRPRRRRRRHRPFYRKRRFRRRMFIVALILIVGLVFVLPMFVSLKPQEEVRPVMGFGPLDRSH